MEAISEKIRYSLSYRIRDTALVTINDIKTKRSICNPIILLKIRRARTWMLVVFDIDIQTSP
jgi:hypothetical protein